MTYLVMGLISFVVVVSILFSLFAPKYFKYAIPALFLVGFAVLLRINDYVGYAIDGSLITDGKEAVVLNTAQSDPWLYYTVLFSGENEPRLVKMPVTEENKKETEKQQEGANIIKFGKKKGGKSAGGSSAGGDGSDFEFMPFSESEAGKKRNGKD